MAASASSVTVSPSGDQTYRPQNQHALFRGDPKQRVEDAGIAAQDLTIYL